MSIDFERIYYDLETALNEFFNPTTENKRKQEIEEALQVFQKNPVSISCSLSFIEHSKNQYILMYCFHVLQTAVDTQWLCMDEVVKTNCKNTLAKIIPDFYKSHASFLSKKLLKLYADIVRLDVASVPNYFDQIFQYITSDSIRDLGLLQLQISLEEFVNVVGSNSFCLLLSTDQREALNLQVKTKLAEILNVLSRLASGLISSYYSNVGSEFTGFFEFVQHYFRTVQKGSVLTIPVEHRTVCCGVLHCLSIIYQFIDLDMLLNSVDLLDFIFGLSYFGCKRSATSPDDDDPEILALNCLIELFSRNFPSVFQFDKLKLFEYLYVINEELISTDTTNPKLNFGIQNETWLKKYVELIRLFFTLHFHRYDGSEKWPCFNLVQNFLSLTDNITNLEMFLQCLDVWNVFLDYLTTKIESKTNEERSKSLKYEPLFDIAVSILINKIHLSNNSLLEDTEIDFNEDLESSDFGQYLSMCSDLLAKIADFQPMVVFQALNSSFESKLKIYFDLTDLDKFVSVNVDDLVLFFDDFQSILKALGRLANLFINEAFWKYNEEIKSFVEKLCRGIVFSGRIKCQLLESVAVVDRVKTEWTNLFAQLLLCIRSYCHWLAQFYADAQRTGENNEIVSSIITSNVDCIAPILLDFSSSNPRILIKAATSNLYSILITVRPHQYLLYMANVRLLYEEASALKFLDYSPEVYNVLYGSLANYLILPWYNAADCEQEWPTRKSMYQKLMKILLNDYATLCQIHSKESIDFNACKRCINVTVPIVTEMLESIVYENVTTKKFCHSVFKPVASGTLHLLRIFSDKPDILEKLLSLTSTLFGSLIIQMGTEFTKETVTTLLHTTQSENLVDLLKVELSSTCKVLELVLRILHCIIKEMSKNFQQFTESVLHLTLYNIRPILNQISSVDLKNVFYEVLYSTMLVRWRYFFPVSVLASMENHSLGDKTEHQNELLILLQTFGDSLTDAEPSIIKLNLAYLNSLNAKWNLYRRAIFIKNLYPDFARAFMSLILNRSQPILNEDFCETLANMTCCCEETVNLFRNELLEQCLVSLGNLKDDQIKGILSKFRMDIEVPSFCLNVQKFSTDVTVLRLSNVC